MFLNFSVGKDSREYSGQPEKKPNGSLKTSTQPCSHSRHKFQAQIILFQKMMTSSKLDGFSCCSHDCTIRGSDRPVREKLSDQLGKLVAKSQH